MNRSMTIYLEQITVDGLYRAATAMSAAGAPEDAPVTVRRLRSGGYDLEVRWGVAAGEGAQEEASDA